MTTKKHLAISLFNECPGYPAPRMLLTRVLTTTYDARRKTPAAVSIMLLDDAAIRRLNKQYKNRDTATDVLAFSDGEKDPQSGRLLLGDIAVSVETARREAAARKLRVRDEVTLYALHGLLHLLGMRDDTDAGRQQMQRAQEAVFAKMDLAYDPACESATSNEESTH